MTSPTAESTDAVLRRLADESDLRELIHSYAFGLDNQDWELWRSVFLDEVIIDMTDFEPEPAPRLLAVEKHVRAVERMFAHFDATQHFIGSHRYAIDGDRAVITAHMRAEHWLTSGQGGDKYTMFGTYTDEAVRTDHGWKLAKVKLSLIREEGNRHIMRLATRRPPTTTSPTTTSPTTPLETGNDR